MNGNSNKITNDFLNRLCETMHGRAMMGDRYEVVVRFAPIEGRKVDYVRTSAFVRYEVSESLECMPADLFAEMMLWLNDYVHHLTDEDRMPARVKAWVDFQKSLGL